MVCFVVTQHSESALSLCLRYSKTSCEATPQKNPRNTRKTRILVKDFVQDSSLDVEPVRRSKIKPFPEATYCCAFSVEIFVEDYIFSCLSARNLRGNLHVKSKDLNGPEIYLIILLSS